MIRGYPNRGQADKSYLGAIAELLCQYPKSAALACADPFHGVVTRTRFMPTSCDVIAFCEERANPIREEAAREARIEQQFLARDEYETQTVSESLKAKGREWLDRTDPKARELAAFNQAEYEARMAKALETIQDANHATFERDCKHEGLDPAGGVSPALVKNLGVKSCRGNLQTEKS